ncbi:ribbon-helix-helix protein, CopG family [Mycolicibacterium poriferae]|jgi:Arc/MetJ-type ribon-helix-helix transcriptional regulator|uniref:ribbon-helix-helix protein, CopG family n=1 Tax=Mycolicibacterium poriferae TaxID=39694 RepID=UPI0024B96281|nr:ribbon-helix-helix protein, CopG family [Mycolicibacterium poriferae]
MPGAQKQQAGVKNVQVRVDLDYYNRIAALAEACGHANVPELIRELLDEALKESDERISELKAKVDAEAKRAKDALDQLAATAKGG